MTWTPALLPRCHAFGARKPVLELLGNPLPHPVWMRYPTLTTLSVQFLNVEAETCHLKVISNCRGRGVVYEMEGVGGEGVTRGRRASVLGCRGCYYCSWWIMCYCSFLLSTKGLCHHLRCCCVGGWRRCRGCCFISTSVSSKLDCFCHYHRRHHLVKDSVSLEAER